MNTTPDFARLRQVFLRQGEPDRVPLGDTSVNKLVMEGFLGRPVRTLEDEVEFWASAGFDHVPLSQGLHAADVMKKGAMTTLRAHYAFVEGTEQEREWASEGQGVITNDREFESFPWPDPDAFDYSAFEQVTRFLPPRVKVIGVVGKVFSGAWWLMGLETFATALVENPDLVARVVDKVGQIQYRVQENMLAFDCVGAIWHADDIAYSESLMIAPRYLRKYIFPWYQQFGRNCAAHDIPMIYHSDGKLDAVIPDIIDCGFAALNPIEPKAMDIVELKRKYGDRLGIIGNIDLGYTLTRGTPEEVEAEVKERIAALAPGGGYAVASSNSIPEYVPLANFNALREATFKYGRYPILA